MLSCVDVAIQRSSLLSVVMKCVCVSECVVIGLFCVARRLKVLILSVYSYFCVVLCHFFVLVLCCCGAGRIRCEFVILLIFLCCQVISLLCLCCETCVVVLQGGIRC